MISHRNEQTRTDGLRALLKEHFGYDEFRPQQERVIANALAGRHSLVIMPTGGGKSLCYQLPALALDGLTLVVSPLIALMKDQVDGLRANGVPAACVHGGLPPAEQSEARRGALSGRLKLLYAAPERVNAPDFLQFLSRLRLGLIAIDEAHCISEWGHDFRPDYRKLAGLRSRFSDVPVMALTATAAERAREDIVRQLRLDGCERFVSSFDRPNLTYSVKSKSRAWEDLLEALDARKGESAIVYCFSRRETEELAERLTRSGHKALAYHAGLDAEARRTAQERFIDGEVPIATATIAFGMGIDKPDVRLVVHDTLPKSIEGYYQETGRAGRDGQPSDCVLFFSEGDSRKHLYFIRQIENEDARGAAERQLREMADYARLRSCRRKRLLAYFGEAMEGETCGRCDVCLTERHATDITVVAQKMLSAAIRTGEQYGVAYLSNVLLGGADKRIRERGHDRLSVYGIVGDYDRRGLRAVAGEMESSGLLERGKYAEIKATSAGREWLRERRPLIAHVPAGAFAPMRTGRSRGGSAQAAPDRSDDALYESLCALQRRVADEMGVSTFTMFTNTTLRKMALAKPRSEAEMLRVSGVGPAKFAQYGHAFLQTIREHTERRESSAPTGESGAPESAYDEALFASLRALRRRLADEEGVPAFVVFNDATLRALAARKPATPEAMLRVSGVGPAKLARYADPFLQAVAAHQARASPPPSP